MAFEAFKQRRDYLALQVEVCLELPKFTNFSDFSGHHSCLCQAALTDESVPMSEELRQALKQYLVMRQDLCHDRAATFNAKCLLAGADARSPAPARAKHLSPDHGEAGAPSGEGPAMARS